MTVRVNGCAWAVKAMPKNSATNPVGVTLTFTNLMRAFTLASRRFFP